MEGTSVDLIAVCQFYDLAEIHDRQSITHMLYHCKIMGDKKVGEAELFLQVLK